MQDKINEIDKIIDSRTNKSFSYYTYRNKEFIQPDED